jgi:hypothetical protein
MNGDVTLSPDALLGARAATEQILDELGLRNYRFDVEPAPAAFDVFVEHEREGAWHAVRLHEEARVLLESGRDRQTRREVAERWRSRLFPGAR